MVPVYSVFPLHPLWLLFEAQSYVIILHRASLAQDASRGSGAPAPAHSTARFRIATSGLQWKRGAISVAGTVSQITNSVTKYDNEKMEDRTEEDGKMYRKP